MLPSGNDAGFCLAKYFGKLLFEKKGYTDYHKTRIRSFEFDYHGSYVKYFLKEMNEQASALKMRNTHWDSPHGLANQENLTTVSDMFKICEKAIQVKLLSQIMGQRVYECRPMREEDGKLEYTTHTYTWVHNGRYLGIDGVNGIKPGWTPAAGHCLAINYSKGGHNFIVVTIQSKSKHPMWTDV